MVTSQSCYIRSSGEEAPSELATCERPDRGGRGTESETIAKSLWSMSTFTFAVSLLALSFLLCEAGESKNTRGKKKWFHCEISLNMLCLQVTHAAQNPARIGGFVPPLGIKIVMNVTARELGILGQIAQHVSMDGWSTGEPFVSACFFFYIHFLLSLVTAEFLTWVKVSLKPSPNTVHYLLTHFKGFWNIINNISFLRDAIMRYVLTCKLPNSLGLWRFAKTHLY